MILDPKKLPPDEEVMWRTAELRDSVPSFYVKTLLMRLRGYTAPAPCRISRGEGGPVSDHEVLPREQALEALLRDVLLEAYYGGGLFEVRCIRCDRCKGGHSDWCFIGRAEAALRHHTPEEPHRHVFVSPPWPSNGLDTLYTSHAVRQLRCACGAARSVDGGFEYEEKR